MYYAVCFLIICLFFFFKHKTAYEMPISDWSSDVCSSDLVLVHRVEARQELGEPLRSDRDDQRGADRGVDGVAAADPVPEPERVGGVDPERGHLVERRRHGDEVLRDRLGLELGGARWRGRGCQDVESAGGAVSIKKK